MKVVVILSYAVLALGNQAIVNLQAQFLQNPQAVGQAADQAIQELNHEFVQFQEQETNNAAAEVNGIQLEGAHPIKTAQPVAQLRGAPMTPPAQVVNALPAVPVVSATPIQASVELQGLPVPVQSTLPTEPLAEDSQEPAAPPSQTAQGGQFFAATDTAMQQLQAEFMQFQTEVANHSAQLRQVVVQEESSNADVDKQNGDIQRSIAQLNTNNQVLRQDVKSTAEENRNLRADLQRFGQKLRAAQAAAASAIEGSDSNDEASIVAAEGRQLTKLVYTAQMSPGALVAPALDANALSLSQPAFAQVQMAPIAQQQQQQQQQSYELVEQPQEQQQEQDQGQPQESEEAMQQEDEEQAPDQSQDQSDNGEYAQQEDPAGSQGPASFMTMSMKRNRVRRRLTPQKTSTLGEDTLSFLTKRSGDFAVQEEKTVQTMETSFWSTVHALRKHHAELLVVQKKLNTTYSSQFALHSRLASTKEHLEATRNHLHARVQMLKGALQNLGQGNDQEADDAINNLHNASAAGL